MPDEIYDELLEETTEFVSKSQIKREIHEIQKLGIKLIAQPTNIIENHINDTTLLQAILDAKKISSHVAKKRQLKYVGKLLAKIDEQELNDLRNLINVKEGQIQQANQHFHHLEKWRDKLIHEQDAAITEILSQYPYLDRQQLRQLVRNAHKELKLDKPPKSSRLIFQLLKTQIPL